MNFKESLLWPLTVPYGAVMHLRSRAYRMEILRQRRLRGTVISVGNLTVGGTGKTPMVLWLVQRLLSEGKSVGILTRGYRGKAASSARQGSPNAGVWTSDEVRLLRARLGDRVSFGVGRDRFARGHELVERGVDWLVLDDGFQHMQLARDVDILLIDAMNPFGGGHLLPAGRLREPRTALGRADIIVITRSNHAPAVETAIRHDSDVPIFYARPQLDSVYVKKNELPGEVDALARMRKLFAFCGIGNPPAFTSDLREWGFEVLGHKFFPDHHRYTQRDVDEIEVAACRAGAEGVICTEKDVHNLLGVRWGMNGVSYCRISLQIDREDDFWRTVLSTAGAETRID
jgi:tetraacyldisaccharide 4'-kinase